MPQLLLRLTGDRPQFQFRLKFPRPIDRRDPKNSFLTALECDFKHPNDGRKWRDRCRLKRQLCRGYSKLGLSATEHELSRFLGISPRTVRWGIAILKAQGFLSNVRRQGYNGPMLRQLHPSLLQRPNITYRTRMGYRGPFASSSLQPIESCRPTPRESCRVTSPQSEKRVPVVFPVVPSRTAPQDLSGATNRRRSQNSFRENPTRNRYRRVGQLAEHAAELLRRTPDLDPADLAEDLKCWAAQNSIGYSDTPAGCNSPIVQAVMIAHLRRGALKFEPFESRRRR